MRRYARKLELLSMLVMIFGVIALCQPWDLFLHSYGATIILVGLIMFNIFSRLKSSSGMPPSGSRDLPGPEH
jgi:predicted membrane metal-binding protein